MQTDPLTFPLPPNVSPMTRSCIETALKAGKLLREGFGTDYLVSPKTMKNDLVTEYDHASEELIIKSLQTAFPVSSFLCEESGLVTHQDAEYCWIIDPLDGTVNFAHNIPLFCISIALAKNDNIISGVIFAPMTQELFVVEKGLGVYLNGKAIKVSKTAKLDNAFVSTSLSFNLHKEPLTSIGKFGQMAYQGFPLRAIGTTALNLAYIAAGRFDAYWRTSGSVNAWDVSAGKLMIEEAGGRVTQCNGKPYSLYEESTVLATNNLLHDEVQDFLKESH